MTKDDISPEMDDLRSNSEMDLKKIAASYEKYELEYLKNVVEWEPWKKLRGSRHK